MAYIGVIGSEDGTGRQYDRLEDFANHHSLIGKIMGVETGFGEGKVFSMQSIRRQCKLIGCGDYHQDK